MTDDIYAALAVLIVGLSFLFFHWTETPSGQDFAIKIGNAVLYLLRRFSK